MLRSSSSLWFQGGNLHQSRMGEVHHTSDKRIPHVIPFSDHHLDDGAIHSDDQTSRKLIFQSDSQTSVWASRQDLDHHHPTLVTDWAFRQ